MNDKQSFRSQRNHFDSNSGNNNNGTSNTSNSSSGGFNNHNRGSNQVSIADDSSVKCNQHEQNNIYMGEIKMLQPQQQKQHLQRQLQWQEQEQEQEQELKLQHQLQNDKIAWKNAAFELLEVMKKIERNNPNPKPNHN